METKKIAVIRIKGRRGLRKEIISTLDMLRLYKKNGCVIIDNNPANMGMINKIKDYVTWGGVNEATIKLILEKRGKLVGHKKLTSQYMKEKLKLDFDSFVKEFISNKKKLKDIPTTHLNLSFPYLTI